MASLRQHVEALAAMERRSAGAGERESADWCAGRWREAGASDVRVEPFRYQHTFGHVQAVAFRCPARRRRGWAAWPRGWPGPVSSPRPRWCSAWIPSASGEPMVCSGLAGLPAVSMLSLRSNAFSDYHLPTDTPDRVDWGSVDRCLAIVEATCRLAP